jgi:hypothetical protein
MQIVTHDGGKLNPALVPIFISTFVQQNGWRWASGNEENAVLPVWLEGVWDKKSAGYTQLKSLRLSV